MHRFRKIDGHHCTADKLYGELLRKEFVKRSPMSLVSMISVLSLQCAFDLLKNSSEHRKDALWILNFVTL